MSTAASASVGPTRSATLALVQPPQPAVRSAQARGLASRRKGQTAERQVAQILSELTGHRLRRKVRQHAGDGDLEGLPGWSVEVKNRASVTRANLSDWWAQTVRQAAATGDKPLLFYKQGRGAWLCVWQASLHCKHASTLWADTLTADPLTWWRMCRHT